MKFANGLVNGSSLIKEWGFVTITYNPSRVYVKQYATAYGNGQDLTPADPAQPATYNNVTYVTQASADIIGSWQIDSSNPERIKLWMDGDTNTYTGFAYISGNSIAIISDSGQGEGFSVAVKIPESISSSEIVGTYKGVIASGDPSNFPSASSITLDASLHISGTYIDSDGNTLSIISQVNPVFIMILPNTVQYPNFDGYTNLYLTFANDFLVALGINSSTSSCEFYGIGIRE